jgi:histidinol phosphatase-like PHP family hydrolase
MSIRFNTDLHVHTFHSPCGDPEMFVSDILPLAVDKGIEFLALTDHYYHFMDRLIFEEDRVSAKETIEDTGLDIQVVVGCETEVMGPGRIAGGPELRGMLDFMMAGATHFQNFGMTELPPGLNMRETALYYLETFRFAVSQDWIDVIAHPFHVVRGVCEPEMLNELTDEDLIPALEIAKENGVAMEISRRALGGVQEQFSRRFYPLCKRIGLKFTIGSDAHRLSQVAQIHCLEPLVNDIGLTEDDLWRPAAKHVAVGACAGR